MLPMVWLCILRSTWLRREHSIEGDMKLGLCEFGLASQALHLEARQCRVTELCAGTPGFAEKIRGTVLSALLFHLIRKHLY